MGNEQTRKKNSRNTKQNKIDSSKITKNIVFKPGPLGFQFLGNCITALRPNGQAQQLGVQVGWKIIRINDHPQDNNSTTTKAHLFKGSQSGKPINLLFETVENPKTE